MDRKWLSGRGLLWQFSLTSFVVVAIIGAGLAWTLSESIRRQAIEELMEEANDTLVLRVQNQLSPDDLTRPMVGKRYEDFERFVEQSVVSEKTARIKVWNREGMVVYSNEPAQVGQTFPIKEELSAALTGRIAGDLSELQAQENVRERRFGRLLEVYAPLRFPGSQEVNGALEIYQTYEPTARFVVSTQRYIYGGLASGLALLYIALFAVVKRGADTISRQQARLQLHAQEIEENYQATLESLSAALDMRDRETEGHSLRVSQLTLDLAKEMNVAEEQLKTIEYGALLHDIGKIGVSDTILLKPGPLTPDEWEQMKKHSALGCQILSNIKFLRDAAEIVHTHHERYDGKGYPWGLVGEAIPLGARIFAVIDAYDAMTNDRPYRKAISHQEAVAEIQRNSGTQFDPSVVEAFLRLSSIRGFCRRRKDLSEPNMALPVTPSLSRDLPSV